MHADDLRYRNDREQANSLLEDPAVKRVREFIEKQEEKGPTGLRRRLLSTSVRLSRKMAPDIYKLSDECVERLSMEIPLELYVYASPQFNAMCFKPEEGRLYVMFSSALLESFSPKELQFVMGHEFGHYIYDHHAIPIGYLVKGQQRPDPKLALRLFAWSRNAEVSADRAGAYCAQDFSSVASGLFKLASGLTSSVVKFDLDEFLNQVDDMQAVDSEPGQGAPEGDWFSTHPFSPLRVKALQLFFRSAMMTAEGGISIDELDVGVQRTMSLMEPSYLDGRSDEAIAMRNLFFAGALAVADAHGGITQAEIDAFEQFFDDGEYSDKLNVARIKEELPQRIQRAKEQSTEPQRMQVLRDLCVIAMADPPMHDQERALLHGIADGLGVSRTFVSQTVEHDIEPD
ncbi:MAG: M48 family metalloprotease [Gammaproteobacteria bacterium]|nr:M48 family metalloprotease [Gammaproteobacteria bacterium]